MAEDLTVKQGKNGTETEPQDKTFTQEELDRIVQERLYKEKQKYGDYEELKAKASKLDELEEAQKSELEKANEKAANYAKQIEEMRKAEEVRVLKEKISDETGVPTSLLNGNTEEEMRMQAEKLAEWRKASQVAPKLKDGGEVPPSEDIDGVEKAFYERNPNLR